MTSRCATPACSTDGATAGVPAAPWAMPSTASSRSPTATAPACSTTWRFPACRRPTTTWSSSSALSATMSGAPPVASPSLVVRGSVLAATLTRLAPISAQDLAAVDPVKWRETRARLKQRLHARVPLPPQSGGIPRRPRTTSLPTASFAALVFLRNSVDSWGSISLLEDVAQRLGPPLEIGQNPLPVALLVVGGAGIGIVHPMAKGFEEGPRVLGGRGGDGLGLAATARQPAEEGAQRRIRTADRHR